ncbi:hypothetical protein GCM10023108_44750 [Saccharopolyspora hordei]
MAAHRARVQDLDAGHRATDRVFGDSAPDDLDLRQFGHENTFDCARTAGPERW